MYSSICQMQKQRQKLLKIFFILNPSMILTVETIVKIVQTRYGLYALRCVEGCAGIDYIQSIYLPRSLPQLRDAFLSKHRKNCECCPGHYLSTSVY